MRTPRFITFTGADDVSLLPGMLKLGAIYPIEWAFLVSQKREGTPRYPLMSVIAEMAQTLRDIGLYRLAAHICGDDVEDILEHGRVWRPLTALLVNHFGRVQINTAKSEGVADVVERWAHPLLLTPILQCRRNFPVRAHAYWLYDASGGRGQSPTAWPISTDEDFVGYAGGLNPDNIVEQHARIAEAAGGDYWIDMESGVRTDERFDLDKVEAVCKAVYG